MPALQPSENPTTNHRPNNTYTTLRPTAEVPARGAKHDSLIVSCFRYTNNTRHTSQPFTRRDTINTEVCTVRPSTIYSLSQADSARLLEFYNWAPQHRRKTATAEAANNNVRSYLCSRCEGVKEQPKFLYQRFQHRRFQRSPHKQIRPRWTSAQARSRLYILSTRTGRLELNATFRRVIKTPKPKQRQERE